MRPPLCTIASWCTPGGTLWLACRLMAFVIRIYGVTGKPAFRLRVIDIFEVRLFVPRTPLVFILGQVEHKRHRFVRRKVAEERIVQLPIWSRAFMNIFACVISRVSRWWSVFLVPSSSHALIRGSTSDAPQLQLRYSPADPGRRCRPLECMRLSSSFPDYPGSAGCRP
jgi:hypothetical protein